MVLREAGQCVAHRAGDGGACPLGTAAGGALAPGEADCAAQFGDQVLAIALGQCTPCWVVHDRRFVDVLLHFGQPAPIGSSSLLVEHGHPDG